MTDITLYLDDNTTAGKSSSRGHKTEFEINDRSNRLRLNFGSEDALDQVYVVFEEFYRRCKELYKKREEHGIT